MSGLQDRIERDENALQKLMQDIPGFDGYREREIRRTADKLLRERLVAELDTTRDALNDVTREWARAGRLQLLTDIDRLARLMGKVRDNIRFADYGYTGFFDAIKIDETALDRLYQYDLGLREHISRCRDSVGALGEDDSADPEGSLRNVETAIGELQDLVDQRENVATSIILEEE